MAVLEKIRVKFGILISVIIALALLSFIIDPSTLESAMNSMSSKYDIGNIAGKKISYTDFQAGVDKFTSINELLTGSQSQNEESQKQIRNAAWQELMDKYMFVKNAKEAGIKVGEAEMIDLISGSNISPVIAQNSAFMDETGVYSPEALNAFIQQVSLDQTGQLRNYWNYIQNTVNTQQYYLKYGSLFSASNIENALQLTDAVATNNTSADVDYCLAMYPIMRDTTVSVSSAEIKAYYDSHKRFFKQKANREIEYVVFEVTPSEADIAGASDEMSSAYEEFLTSANLKSFLLKNSDRQLTEYWYKAGELSTINTEINDAIFSEKKVSEIIKSGNSFFAAREVASKMIPDSAFVKHILLQGTDSIDLADSLVTVLKKGGNFSTIALAYSADKSSSADGQLGSIGWMTQSYMIPGFESIFDAKVGEPFVLNTQYGTHIVVVSEKTAPVLKKQVAVLEKTALASKETFNSYYSQANTFATLAAGSYEGYQKAIDSTKVYSHSLTITEATANYGAIEQAKEVTRWVFDAKPGKASNIITVNNNFFFIAALKKVNKEGIAPINDVASMISERLYSQKVQAKAVEDVRAKVQDASSIEAIASTLGVAADRNEAMSFAATNVDPALLGAASIAEEGKVYGPVAGSMGVYYLSVSNKQTGSFYTEEDAKNLATQKAQYMSQIITSVMSEYDNVVDNRERFF